MKTYKTFKELRYNIKLTEEIEKPKSKTDRDIENVDNQMKDLRDKNKDDKSSARSIDLIKLGDKKAKLNVDKAKEKAAELESVKMKSFSAYIADEKQASNIYVSEQHTYNDIQIGHLKLKNGSEVGYSLLQASKADIKMYGKGTCRIETQNETSIIKIDPFKGQISWLSEEVCSGKTNDIKWERPETFYELLMPGKESELGFDKWIKVLGY